MKTILVAAIGMVLACGDTMRAGDRLTVTPLHPINCSQFEEKLVPDGSMSRVFHQSNSDRFAFTTVGALPAGAVISGTRSFMSDAHIFTTQGENVVRYIIPGKLDACVLSPDHTVYTRVFPDNAITKYSLSSQKKTIALPEKFSLQCDSVLLLAPGHTERVVVCGRWESEAAQFVVNACLPIDVTASCIAPFVVGFDFVFNAQRNEFFANKGCEIEVYDVEQLFSDTSHNNGEAIPKDQFDNEHQARGHMLCTPDGTILAIVGANSGQLYNFDTKEWTSLSFERDTWMATGYMNDDALGGFSASDEVQAIACSPDSRLLAVARRTNIVKLHNVHTGKCQQDIDFGRECTVLFFSEDNSKLMGVDKNGYLVAASVLETAVQ